MDEDELDTQPVVDDAAGNLDTLALDVLGMLEGAENNMMVGNIQGADSHKVAGKVVAEDRRAMDQHGKLVHGDELVLVPHDKRVHDELLGSNIIFSYLIL